MRNRWKNRKNLISNLFGIMTNFNRQYNSEKRVSKFPFFLVSLPNLNSHNTENIRNVMTNSTINLVFWMN